MNTKNILFFVVVTLCTICKSQNIVPNGGFELYSSLPTSFGQINLAAGWNLNPTDGTPEYFNALVPAGNIVGIPTNYFGGQPANNGNAYSGIIPYASNPSFPGYTYREYIQTQLSQPLIVGKTYYWEFYVSLARGLEQRIATNNIGILFSSTQLNYQTGSYYLEIPLTPTYQYPTVITDSTNWTIISGCFTSTSPGIQYIIIGNFNNNANTIATPLVPLPSGVSRAYYYIDDVSVIDFQAGNSQSICPSQTVNISCTAASSYSWFPSSSLSCSTCQSPIASPTTTTTYTVTAAIGTCTVSDTVTIAVNFGLIVSAGNNVTVCTGTIVTLSASGGNTYSWYNGLTTSSITVNPTTTTTYTVVGTDANGCSGSNSVTVFVTPSIIANAGPDGTICLGDTIALTASGGTGYNWIPSTGLNNSNVSNPIASPTTTTTYTVVVTSGLCTPASDSVTIVVNPNPSAVAWSNVTITVGSSATLFASGGGTYTWSIGAIGSNISVSPLTTTKYCVTVSDSNCIDTACVTVFVEPYDCSPAVTGELFLPNAFSPNEDNENDVLKIYFGDMNCIKTFELFIYNRWGEKVFETTSPIAQWNGSYKGKIESTAVFTYYMKATLLSEEKIVKKGNISLMR